METITNFKGTSIKSTRECINKDHTQIWHEPYRHINHDEDNDTSDDEATTSESEEELTYKQ